MKKKQTARFPDKSAPAFPPDKPFLYTIGNTFLEKYIKDKAEKETVYELLSLYTSVFSR